MITYSDKWNFLSHVLQNTTAKLSGGNFRQSYITVDQRRYEVNSNGFKFYRKGENGRCHLS